MYIVINRIIREMEILSTSIKSSSQVGSGIIISTITSSRNTGTMLLVMLFRLNFTWYSSLLFSVKCGKWKVKFIV